VLVEDDENFIGRVRAALRDTGVDSELIERYFPLSNSFDKGISEMGYVLPTRRNFICPILH
jgi:hypothetical protein